MDTPVGEKVRERLDAALTEDEKTERHARGTARIWLVNMACCGFGFGVFLSFIVLTSLDVHRGIVYAILPPGLGVILATVLVRLLRREQAGYFQRLSERTRLNRTISVQATALQRQIATLPPDLSEAAQRAFAIEFQRLENERFRFGRELAHRAIAFALIIVAVPLGGIALLILPANLARLAAGVCAGVAVMSVVFLFWTVRRWGD